MRLDVQYFVCDFSDSYPRLYCSYLKHNVSADVSTGLPPVSFVYLAIEMIQPGKSFLKFDCWSTKAFKFTKSWATPKCCPNIIWTYRTLHSYNLIWAVCHLFPQRWRTLNVQSRETIGQEDHVICLQLRRRAKIQVLRLEPLIRRFFL